MQHADMFIEMFVDLLNVNQWLIMYANQELKTLLANWHKMQKYAFAPQNFLCMSNSVYEKMFSQTSNTLQNSLFMTNIH